jgi:chemosensory pili system protein ChpA (sensor histidine kinase/response regulator)
MQAMVAQSLDLVSDELTATLDEARAQLEEYVDGNASQQSLSRCADLLHLSRGALKVAEVDGAALLAEEMEETCRYLGTASDQDTVDKGIGTLIRAMVQLPAYLDRLLSGGRDVALVLLPLLNDLRQHRGKPQLSEGTLVLLNKASSAPAARRAEPSVTVSEEGAQAFRQTVGGLRREFQSSLLGWLRDEDSAGDLAELIRVSRELERATSVESARQLWYVLTGVLEALRDGGLEATISLKRLVGQADRQLKRLMDGGEAAFVDSPPVELLNSLLYYAARAAGDGERLGEIRTAYELTDVVPGEERLAEASQALAGPSVKLMRAVAEAIKEDLASVKDVLDIFVRTGMANAVDLEPQLEMLKKISDTLGVLGLASSRDDIQKEAKALTAIIASERAPEEAELERMAATLLDVEDALDTELVRAVVPFEDDEDAAQETSVAQLRQATESVIAECIVNLARVKEAVVELIKRPGDARALDQVGPQLRGITAGLLMLGKTKAVGVVERIGNVIATRLAAGAAPLAIDLTDRMADAVVSLEYYIETVSAGRRDPWYMLENAERCLVLLEATPESQEAEALPVRQRQPDAAPVPEVPVAATVMLPPEVMKIGAERPDPELVEVFIEEAKQEVENIQRYLPIWQQNQDDLDALNITRRSFHTLKGSGRMVGAQVIGEFAWSIESLLNRIINHTLSPSAEALQFLTQTAEFLPQLVEQLEIGTQPSGDVDLLIKQANAFAEGDPEAGAVMELSSQPETVADSTPTEEPDDERGVPPQMDPVLADIFVKEMRGHLETIRESLADIDDKESPLVEEPLFRASHTLLGSANMAGYEPAIALTTPLAEYLGQKYETGSPLSQNGQRVLLAAADTLERMAGALSANEAFAEDTSETATQLAALVAADTDSGAEPPAPQPDEALDAEEFDPEIAAIFAEEAAEILESADRALQDFSRGDAELESLVELQRLLHTLKGGARMAGITSMGNLSHSLEGLLSGMSAAKVEPTKEVMDLVQRSLDELHHMRDAVAVGQQAAATVELPQLMRSPSGAGSVELPAEPLSASADAEEQEEDAATQAIPVGPTLEIPGLQWLEPDRTEGAEDSGIPAPPEDVESAFDAPGDGDEEHAAAAAAEVDEAKSASAAAEPMAQAVSSQELVRVEAELLDALLNGAGEISIFQSRLNQQARSIDFNLGELDQTVTRLREQLRSLEAETEAEILHRHEEEGVNEDDFDPLELDRYSKIQQLSRALAETASDVGSINELLRELMNETETLVTQQTRVTSELQDGLMKTRMVPFQRHVPRLTRIVRQASGESGKSAELVVEGGEGELDRQVLESMLPPFEHLLRNAVIHGIERPEIRRERGKPAVGRVTVTLQREGSEVLVQVADDGAGLDLDSVRRKAYELGLLAEGQEVSDVDAAELILHPGLTTVGELTQAAGRGVGMDIVANELKKLGGSMRIESVPEQGTRFLLRLPYTLAITNALIVAVGEETFALPLPTVEGVTRVAKDKLLELLTEDQPSIDYGGVSYRVQHLGTFVGAAPSALPEEDTSAALILIRAGDTSTALLTDALEDSREVVVKTLGSQITSVPGVSGATILGDGRIIVILDMGTLVRAQNAAAGRAPAPMRLEQQITALVVDDSITVRRVTQKLLERHGVRVLTARDGLDAVGVIQDHEPDIILLDIEMPRMDGYQFATHVRNDPRIENVPIIMITSRSGEKHRARAIEIGVNDYLSKPYQEGQLKTAIETLLGREL